MDGVNSFLLAFCVGCVVLGGLYMLCPKGKFEKSVKYVFSLCFICCIISSFSGIGGLSFDIASKSESDLISVGAAAESARIVFERALTKSQINFSKITVLTDKAEDGSIFISKVTVVSPESREKILDIIAGDGSYEVEIINE